MPALTCPIFLINLDGSTGRLESARRQMESAELTFTRLAAVDGRGRKLADFPTYDATASRRKFGRDMTTGEIGCYLSHQAAAKAFLNSGADAGLVLEDDFLAQPGAWEIAGDVFAHMQGTDSGWELVNLSRKPRMLRKPVHTSGWLPDGMTLFRAPYFPVVSTALLWSRAGAARFAAQAPRPSGPVDHVIRRLMCETGQGFALDPAPFGTTGAKSDIAAASVPPGPALDKNETAAARRSHRAELKRQGSNIALALRARILGPRSS